MKGHFGVSKIKALDLSYCQVSIIEVTDIIIRNSGWCDIVGEDSRKYQYKMKNYKDHPNLFSVIKAWWANGKNSDRKLKTIKKWELSNEDLASDESLQTEFEDGTDD